MDEKIEDRPSPQPSATLWIEDRLRRIGRFLLSVTFFKAAFPPIVGAMVTAGMIISSVITSCTQQRLQREQANDLNRREMLKVALSQLTAETKVDKEGNPVALDPGQVAIRDWALTVFNRENEGLYPITDSDAIIALRTGGGGFRNLGYPENANGGFFTNTLRFEQSHEANQNPIPVAPASNESGGERAQ